MCSRVVDQLQEGDAETSGLPSPLALRVLCYLEVALLSWGGDSRHAINKAERVRKREDAE